MLSSTQEWERKKEREKKMGKGNDGCGMKQAKKKAPAKLEHNFE